jgi:hypothetical protein
VTGAPASTRWRASSPAGRRLLSSTIGCLLMAALLRDTHAPSLVIVTDSTTLA